MTDSPFFDLVKLFSPLEREGLPCFYRASPGLAVAPSGTVFATNQERMGTVGDSFNRKNVVLRRSKDHGKTWLPMQVLVSEPGFSCSSGVLMVDQIINRVFIFYGRAPFEDASTGHNEAWNVENPTSDRGQCLIYSDDDGENWSTPVDITEMIQYEAQYSTTWARTVNVGQVRRNVHPGGPPGAGFQLREGDHKGRLVASARVWVKPIWDLNVYSHNCVILSDNHGATWRVGGLSQPGMGESSIVELDDGTIYMSSRNESIRCRGYRGYDLSFDGGETFIESGYDLTLVEPHCHAALARYSRQLDGQPNRVLFSNPAVHSNTVGWFDGPARRELTVRISYDECRTWPVARVIYPGPAGYSALTVAQDQTILCQFEHATQPGQSSASEGRISIARFNLAWLTEEAEEG